jgi:hypothetical protein
MNPLDPLVEKLRKALGQDLVSVVLYGSAAVGDHDAKFSDYNILCVVTQIGPPQLRASEPVMRWWREQGNPSPLLLTEREIATTTDCFAIEFHDIQEHHKILFGADVVSGIAIDDSFYRAQVEHELRAKLLRLRQKASGILSDGEALRRLMMDSVSTFCVLTRHALLLHGFDAPARKREVVAAAQKEFGIDGGPFLTLLNAREGKGTPKVEGSEELLGAYLREIGTIIDRVDGLQK